MHTKTRVSTAPTLDLSLLQRLAVGDLIACQIPCYYDPAHSKDVVSRIVSSPAFSHYKSAGAENIGHLGSSAFEGADKDYYALATKHMREVRQAFLPLQNPMDRLRCELAETWPAGAQVANFGRGMAFCGLVRTFAEGAEALPHNDVVQRDVLGAEDVPHGFQLAGNVHLTAAADGGELELWDRSLNETDYAQLRLPDSYGLDRGALGQPDLVLKPTPGDLILFNSKLPHAVRPARGGIRAAVSCFLIGTGPNQPIYLYS